MKWEFPPLIALAETEGKSVLSVSDGLLIDCSKPLHLLLLCLPLLWLRADSLLQFPGPDCLPEEAHAVALKHLLLERVRAFVVAASILKLWTGIFEASEQLQILGEQLVHLFDS